MKELTLVVSLVLAAFVYIRLKNMSILPPKEIPVRWEEDDDGFKGFGH